MIISRQKFGSPMTAFSKASLQALATMKNMGGRILSRRRRGMNIIEVSLVLGLIGIALAGIFTIYTIVENRSLENRTKILVQNLVAGTNSLFVGSTNYASIGTTTALNQFLIDSKKVPINYVSSATDITSPFNTAITVVPTTATVEGVAAGRAFQITITDAPTHICNALFTEQMTSQTVLAVKAGSTNTLSPKRSGNRALNAANIANRCNDADPITIVMTFQ